MGDVPFCIIKGKARLGQLVHKKTATCVALTTVRPEDKADLDKLAASFKSEYNENPELRRMAMESWESNLSMSCNAVTKHCDWSLRRSKACPLLEDWQLSWMSLRCSD